MCLFVSWRLRELWGGSLPDSVKSTFSASAASEPVELGSWSLMDITKCVEERERTASSLNQGSFYDNSRYARERPSRLATADW